MGWEDIPGKGNSVYKSRCIWVIGCSSVIVKHSSIHHSWIRDGGGVIFKNLLMKCLFFPESDRARRTSYFKQGSHRIIFAF